MMSPDNSAGKNRVAFLLESGFEDAEFQIPYTALQKTSAEVVVLGRRMNDEYKGKRGQVTIEPDATTTEVRAEDFDAIIIPGGHAPDKIRTNDNAVRLVINAMALDKLVAAVCHGPQVLIEADQLRGRRATGYRAIRKDMTNAGAEYIDEPVVVESNLITSRRPGDMALFTTIVLSNLGLMVEGEALPDIQNASYEWWRIAEGWGGSSRLEILGLLNTALIGERYTLAAFRQYAEKLSDPQAKILCEEVVGTKNRHVEQLEGRLAAFDEQASWQAAGSEAFAALQNWIQSNEEAAILRRALGDLQTGVVDAGRFSSQLTDPITAALFEEIETNLARHEETIGQLYRDRSGQSVAPPTPTTVAIG